MKIFLLIIFFILNICWGAPAPIHPPTLILDPDSFTGMMIMEGYTTSAYVCHITGAVKHTKWSAWNGWDRDYDKKISWFEGVSEKLGHKNFIIVGLSYYSCNAVIVYYKLK